MISSETPYKLAELIRDTWPGLYRPFLNKESNIEIICNTKESLKTFKR